MGNQKEKSNIYDLIIIGAGPAGLTAAIYAGRAKMNVLVVDKETAGGQIKITSEITNYPGIIRTDGPSLIQNMTDQATSFGVKILKAEVDKIDFGSKIKKLNLSDGKTIESYSIIISTGAQYRTAGFEGETEFQGRGVGYCATCDGEFFTDMDVFVVGAGLSAAEEAIFLTRYAKKVYIIARSSELSCPETVRDKVLANKKITIKFNTEIVSLSGTNVLKSAKLINNQTNEIWDYQVSDDETSFGVFVFVGFKPVSELFKSEIELDSKGYILSDENLQTNKEGVFVAGDIRPKPLRQLVTAVSDGAIAALSAEKYVAELKYDLGIVETESTEISEDAGDSTSQDFFDDELKIQLKKIFEGFDKTVGIISILDNESEEKAAISDDIKKFMTNLGSISDKIKIKFYNKGEVPDIENRAGVWTYPVTMLMDEKNDFTGISYYGIPGGHEFNSFIIALRSIAGSAVSIESSLLERIKKIKQKTLLQTCVLLTCTNCPEVVVACQNIALNNKNITCETIDISKFPKVQQKYNIMSVPLLLINEKPVLYGRRSLEEVVTAIENEVL